MEQRVVPKWSSSVRLRIFARNLACGDVAGVRGLSVASRTGRALLMQPLKTFYRAEAVKRSEQGNKSSGHANTRV